MKSTLAAAVGALVILLTGPTPARAFGPGTVVNANDAGPGSLRAAMASGASLIDFDPGFFGVPRSIKLNSPLPYINADLSIIGPGATLLTVDGQFKSNPTALVNILNTSTVVRLEGFTLTGGYDPLSTGDVGGIFSRGRLTLDGLRLSNNRGTALFNQGGVVLIEETAVASNSGQGMVNQGGTLGLRQSFVGSNGAEGIFNQGGRVTIANSTFAQNNGGIFNQVGDLSIYNSTISANRDYGVISVVGGAPVQRLFTAHSTIFANHSSFDLALDGNASVNYSLLEFIGTTVNGVGNIIGVDPQLGPLAYQGGLTPGFLPQAGSPAIDFGSNPLNLAIDQRGVARVINGRADIGAVETIPEPASSLLLAIASGGFAGRRRLRNSRILSPVGILSRIALLATKRR